MRRMKKVVWIGSIGISGVWIQIMLIRTSRNWRGGAGVVGGPPYYPTTNIRPTYAENTSKPLQDIPLTFYGYCDIFNVYHK